MAGTNQRADGWLELLCLSSCQTAHLWCQSTNQFKCEEFGLNMSKKAIAGSHTTCVTGLSAVTSVLSLKEGDLSGTISDVQKKGNSYTEQFPKKVQKMTN